VFDAAPAPTMPVEEAPIDAGEPPTPLFESQPLP
jgi:hypothetical protein